MLRVILLFGFAAVQLVHSEPYGQMLDSRFQGTPYYTPQAYGHTFYPDYCRAYCCGVSHPYCGHCHRSYQIVCCQSSCCESNCSTSTTSPSSDTTTITPITTTRTTTKPTPIITIRTIPTKNTTPKHPSDITTEAPSTIKNCTAQTWCWNYYRSPPCICDYLPCPYPCQHRYTWHASMSHYCCQPWPYGAYGGYGGYNGFGGYYADGGYSGYGGYRGYGTYGGYGRCHPYGC